jgi:hypothetical protein
MVAVGELAMPSEWAISAAVCIVLKLDALPAGMSDGVNLCGDIATIIDEEHDKACNGNVSCARKTPDHIGSEP